MNRAPDPPWLAHRLLELALPEEDREVIGGDLLEVFLSYRTGRGRVRAWLWYWGQALSFSGLFLCERIRERAMWSPDAEFSGITAPWRSDRDHVDRWDSAWAEQEIRRYRRRRMQRMLEVWTRDISHAVRSLLRAPGFTFVTVVTLALAIGANTAIFSVVDAVLLDALPFPDADRLVSVQGTAPGSELEGEFGVADELYVQYREEADRFEDTGLYSVVQSTARADEQIERLFMTLATPSLFTTLGVTPVLGRLPTAEDDDRVLVISHWLWTTWFGGDESVLGRSFLAAGATRTVIGVMGPDFQFPDERIALWIPWVIDPAELTPGGFGRSFVGRMVPGTDHAAVEAELAPLARRLLERFGGPPPYVRIIEQHRPVVRSLEEQLVGNIAGPLWLLLGTVGIVLLIACANVANLFMVRAESRRRDFALRRALGAGRGGLIRSQMAEALVLAVAGGTLGALLGWAGVPLLVRAAPEGIPRLGAVSLDSTVLLFTAGVSILAACAFGLIPAFRFTNPSLIGGLRQAGGTGTRSGHRIRNALVVLQTASALVLLVGSGLLVRSFIQLSRVDPGFETDDIFTFQIAPSSEDLTDGPSFARFHLTFMERVAGLPGVESVGVVNELPLDEGADDMFFVTDRTDVSGAETPLLRFTFTGGDYFQSMDIGLVSGRYFDVTDHISGAASAIIGQSTAELLWPGEDPLGKRMRPSEIDGMWWTVIGVVEDVLLDSFRRENAEPMVYFPLVGPNPELYAVGSPAYVVKTSRAEVIAPEIRELVREAAPESPMYRIFTMAGLAARSTAQLSFTMLALAVAAGLALILGAVGLYGVLSYVVSQRTREIGIRMALGAQARELRRMVVAQGGRVTVLGVGIGLIAAFLLTRLLDSLLFGVGAIDAFTFAAMSAVLVAVALLASYIPARRASSVDPMRSLRSE